MRALALLPLVAFVACAAPRAEHPVVALEIPPAPTAPTPACSAPAAPAVKMCDIPGGSNDFMHKGLVPLDFQTCDDYVPEFQYRISDACRDALPKVAKIVGDLNGEREDSGLYTHDAMTERNARMVAVSLPLLPPRCRTHFPDGVAADDVDRAIWEVDSRWRDCQPDPEVAASYTFDEGTVVHHPTANVPVGAFLLAIVLEPHLGPLGKQYLRKFMVCEMIEMEARHDLENRANIAKGVLVP